MAAEKSYARLGLFLVVVVMVILTTGLLFLQRLRSRDVIRLVTYTTENVSGLEISSPVRYRGVSIGRVGDVPVDPGGVIVEIGFEMFLDRLGTIGVNAERIRQITDISGIAPKLRARVVSNPVTGEAYLLLDVPENPPPPMTLGFTPDRPYVPWMPSPLSTVTGSAAGHHGACRNHAAGAHGNCQSRFPRAWTGAIDFSRTWSASSRRARSRL